MKSIKAPSLLAPLLLLLGMAAAQTATLTSTTTLVTVPVLVRSPSGELLLNLTARDFRLTDNGVEQRVALAQVERRPLSVLILMQTGGAAPPASSPTIATSAPCSKP